MAAGAALTGLAGGIFFLAIFAMSIPPHPLLGDYHELPDQDDYTPLAQFRIDGLKDVYKAGERIDFSVSFVGIGCRWPESIAVVNSKSGAVVWGFNGISASSILLCPVVTNPSEFGMTWNLRDHVERLAIDQPGQYAVVVRHEHAAMQNGFAVE